MVLAAMSMITRETASLSNQKEGNTDEGDGIAMNRQEDDEHYENGKGAPPRRPQRTKFKEFDDDENAGDKRSHRQKRGNDDVWPDTDD